MSDRRKMRPRPLGFVLKAAAPPDAIAPSESHWTQDGVDRLFYGDVIRIRQGEKVSAGIGAHGQAIWEETRTPAGRTINTLVETTTFAKVIGVGEKRGIPTVFYTVIASDSRLRSQNGGSLSQAAVVEDNAVPAARRQREVRRLRDSGPSDEVRATVDPVAHAHAGRAREFAEMLRRTGGAGRHRIFQGDVLYGQDLEPVTPERVEGWARGEERVPTWAMSALAEIERKLGLPVDEAGAAYAPAPAPVEPPPLDDEPDDEDGFSLDRSIACDHPEYGVILEGDYIAAVDEDGDDD